MARELFDLGSNGVTQSKGYEEDGQIILTETMPAGSVERILKENHKLGQGAMAKTRKDGMGIVGASIPITLHHKWRTEWRQGPKLWGQPWHKFLRAKLQDPNYKKLVHTKF